jgi:hypothetical protein
MPRKGLLYPLALALCLILSAAACLLPPAAAPPQSEMTRNAGAVRHLGVSPCLAAGVPVSLRINTSHALDSAQGAVLDAGLSPSEVRVTPSSPGSDSFLPPDRFLADAKRAGATILSSSFSGWQSLYDSLLYQKLTQNGMVHVYAYVPTVPQPENAPPPAAFVTVNRIGGKTGHGIEFGIPTTYMHGKGQSSTPSGVTAQLAGLMACLRFLHPAWNWFDVKAALRQTAANYPSGYDPQKYGYGVVDYPAANALHDARELPLFAPAAVLHSQQGNALPFSINPFLQTRRAADALFKFRSAPGTSRSELSLAEIMARGGQLVFLGDSAKSGNSAVYPVTREELAYFVWFTRDAGGRFSRIEPYSVLGPVHLVPQQLYGPRMSPFRELKSL